MAQEREFWMQEILNTAPAMIKHMQTMELERDKLRETVNLERDKIKSTEGIARRGLLSSEKVSGMEVKGREEVATIQTGSAEEISKWGNQNRLRMQELAGRWDLQKINTQAGRDEILTGLRGNIEKELAKLNNTSRENIVTAELTNARFLMKEKLDSIEYRARLSESNKRILLNTQLTHDEKVSALDRASREGISRYDIEMRDIMSRRDTTSREKIAAARELNLFTMNDANISAKIDQIEAMGVQERENLKTQSYLRIQELSTIMDKKTAQELVLKELEADKTFVFKPTDFGSLYEEKGGIGGLGLDESEIIDEYSGYGEGEEAKPGLFGTIAKTVENVMETNPLNPARIKVLDALVRIQGRFSDPRFYDAQTGLGGAFGGETEAGQAYDILTEVQGLISKLEMDSQGLLGNAVSKVQPLPAGTYDPNQDIQVIEALIGAGADSTGTAGDTTGGLGPNQPTPLTPSQIMDFRRNNPNMTREGRAYIQTNKMIPPQNPLYWK